MAAMNQDQFEQAYDLIAQAIDRSGPDRERLFLARLALALASQASDLDALREALRIAEQDLERTGAGTQGS